MTACVFLGPSLPEDEARAILPAVVRPPAQQGDVYRAAASGSFVALGLVDGYFEGRLAVWHKEILWALSRGIHVFGAASMGALRAAELDTFGMRGVGWIYEAYRDGRLDGDDEVALLHSEPAPGYPLRHLSEAMVNVRRTLERAERASIVPSSEVALVIAAARRIHYKQRDIGYRRVLEAARGSGVGQGTLDALGAWLPAGRVDQKRDDAIAMLVELRDFLASEPGPLMPAFEFEHTWTFDALIDAARRDGEGAGDGPAGPLRREGLLEDSGTTRAVRRRLARAARTLED